ncbi:MAG: hypothetical protein Q9182_004448 [Xanthomendoza sp. 2 TL-2023]
MAQSSWNSANALTAALAELDSFQPSELADGPFWSELSSSGLHNDHSSELMVMESSMANSGPAHRSSQSNPPSTLACDIYPSPALDSMKVSPHLIHLPAHQQLSSYQGMTSEDASQTRNQESDQCELNAFIPFSYHHLDGVRELTAGETACEAMSRELPHELSTTSACGLRDRPLSDRNNSMHSEIATPTDSDFISLQDRASIRPGLNERNDSQASLHVNPGPRQNSGLYQPDNTPLKTLASYEACILSLSPCGATSNGSRLAPGSTTSLTSPPHEERRHHCNSALPAADNPLVDVSRSSALDNPQSALSQRQQEMHRWSQQEQSHTWESDVQVRPFWNDQAQHPIASKPDFQQAHRLPPQDSNFDIPTSDSDHGTNFVEGYGPSAGSVNIARPRIGTRVQGSYKATICPMTPLSEEAHESEEQPHPVASSAPSSANRSFYSSPFSMSSRKRYSIRSDSTQATSAEVSPVSPPLDESDITECEVCSKQFKDKEEDSSARSAAVGIRDLITFSNIAVRNTDSNAVMHAGGGRTFDRKLDLVLLPKLQP